MRAGFQGDVEGASLGLPAGVRDGHDFRMGLTEFLVVALAHHASPMDQHGPDQWIGVHSHFLAE